MAMDGKKISFGFIKTKKVDKLVEEKKDYIECVEEKSIKVIGGEAITDDIPLIIPMKPNTMITAERLKQIAEEVEKGIQEPDLLGKAPIPVNDKPPENETLDQMAVRELLQNVKKEENIVTPALTVSLPSKPVIDGEKESTLEDYETVPIQDFGMAMLRGMGWTPGNDKSKYKPPELRPKGLGLGADKVISENQKKNAPQNKDDDLTIVKNAFVKITTGKYVGCYGKVVSLDEDNGRVMIDIPLKKEIVSLSEFMIQPVTKGEYDKQSRVINSAKYDEYKKGEGTSKKDRASPNTSLRAVSSSKKLQDVSRQDCKERNETQRKQKEKSSNGRSTEDRDRRQINDSSSSDDMYNKRKEKKTYSSNDSLNSISDSEKERKRKENRRRHSSSDSDSYKKHKKDKKYKNTEGKRDIDKKRKGKKKKRDRDRSPNYRKHRK